MKKAFLKNAAILYAVLYTVATILNSVIYLSLGIRDDPSGNWHEIDRAVIVLIVVVAFELCRNLKTRPNWLRFVIAYIPSVLLALGYVWLMGFRGEGLAATAYRDIWINFTAGFILLCVVLAIVDAVRKRKRRSDS